MDSFQRGYRDGLRDAVVQNSELYINYDSMEFKWKIECTDKVYELLLKALNCATKGSPIPDNIVDELDQIEEIFRAQT